MEHEVLGVEHLKNSLKLAFDVTKQINTSGADGWQFSDGFAFVDELVRVPGVIKDGKVTLAELGDLSDAERTELKVWVADEFDIPNDEAEGWIEDGLDLAFSIVSLVNRHRNKGTA